MSTPPELDGFTDFLDNDRLKETFSSGSLDFDEWTLFISKIETSFPDDIEKLCLVYDAFLLEFPLCHGYWKKYAYHKIKLCTLEDAVEVFERAVQAATYSVVVWFDYCTFAVAAYEDPHDVSRLFERGLSFVGKDYSCCSLWDKYIEYLLGLKQWSSLAHVYLRTLKYPSKKLDFYYKNFRKIAASLKEKIQCRIDVNGDVSSDLMEEDLVTTPHTDEEISIVIRDLMGPSSSSAVSKALHAYLSIGEQFYKDSQQLMEKISCFETQIRRPYFHVKPLDTNQLENWHAYLNFAETYGDFDWAIKLYERCLLPCANYTEFWFRYVDFVESKGGRELANFALARASQTFVKNASVVHLYNARFKEHIGDASAASVALSRCGDELGIGFVENVTKKANMERRLGNFEAAVTTYREALKKTLIGKEHLETTTLLYVQFSRLKYMITNNANEAAQILIEGNEKVPHCKLLLEELIRLLMMHGGSRQVDLLDPIIDKEISHQADSSDGLSAEDKEEISNLYMEFIDLSGSIHDVRKALGRHIKLFPHSARAKLHASRPLGKSFRELIQRREKTRECLNQDVSTEKGIDSTVVSPPKETKEQSLDCDGNQSNLSLASGLQVEENNNVAERENLCESQSDLSMGLKTNEGGERSHEVSLPIQATPNHGFVTKQAHFSCNPVDTVKSDAIVIQPSGSRSPQSYQNQEFARQAGRNRYYRTDLNQTHRDSNPRSHERSRQMSYSPVGIVREIHGQHMGVAPRDNQAALQNSISQIPQNQCQNSVSQMHPEVQTSNPYPQTQIPGQHMSVAPSDNPATLQNSIPQNPQNQYQGSTSQVQTSFAYPQTQIPVQSNDQQGGQIQSNEAYNQMWQQYYYNYYYYQQQQQQQLMSEQPQPNQNSQPQLDQNLVQLLSKQYQSQAKTPYSQSQWVEQQQSQEPQSQQQIQFQQQQQQQEWFQQQQHWQQQQYLLYLQQQQLQEEAKGDEHRLSTPQVSTTNSDIQKSQESGGVNEANLSSDTSISSI
ncbi:Pre-mRNA-processing factor 39-2 [Cardamine amara subsp. amara]|uniref:Pre-mRNA-processing factor 39-2 n=1 Tax=Cardamine amara subsp. amara TaxID=228776 RepID=A0ABD1BTH1_CARAN